MLYSHSNRLNALISKLHMFWSVLLRKFAILVAKCCETFNNCNYLFFKLNTGLLYTIQNGLKLKTLKGQNHRFMVEPSEVVKIHTIYVCFDSKFWEEFKFKIIWDYFLNKKMYFWKDKISKPNFHSFILIDVENDFCLYIEINTCRRSLSRHQLVFRHGQS